MMAMPALRSRNGQCSEGSSVMPTAPKAVPSHNASSEMTTVLSSINPNIAIELCGTVSRASQRRE